MSNFEIPPVDENVPLVERIKEAYDYDANLLAMYTAKGDISKVRELETHLEYYEIRLSEEGIK